jgi:hypothetical protein
VYAHGDVKYAYARAGGGYESSHHVQPQQPSWPQGSGPGGYQMPGDYAPPQPAPAQPPVNPAFEAYIASLPPEQQAAARAGGCRGRCRGAADGDRSPREDR